MVIWVVMYYGTPTLVRYLIPNPVGTHTHTHTQTHSRTHMNDLLANISWVKDSKRVMLKSLIDSTKNIIEDNERTKHFSL